MESGTLARVTTTDLLRRLAATQATGCLRIRHDATQATVYFRDGLVYTATAPAARARLGDRLVGAGHISEEQLTETLEYQRSLSRPRRIGELLIERGLIDRETMRTYVREQIADSVAVALGWTDGTWSFMDGEEVPEDAPLDASVENLLMEGARRLEEWSVIEARLGSVEAVVDFASDGSAAELSLTPDEWSMLTRIDGASTIAEIADAAGYGQFEAARIIYGLLTAGVVALVDAGGPEGEHEAQSEPSASREPEPPAEPEPWVEPEPAAADDEDREPEPWVEPEPEPAAAEEWLEDPAAWLEQEGEPAPLPEPDEEVRDPVDRKELLREFAALDHDFSTPPPPPTPARPVPPPAPADDDEDSERRERRGIFRRRRE